MVFQARDRYQSKIYTKRFLSCKTGPIWRLLTLSRLDLLDTGLIGLNNCIALGVTLLEVWLPKRYILMASLYLTFFMSGECHTENVHQDCLSFTLEHISRYYFSFLSPQIQRDLLGTITLDTHIVHTQQYEPCRLFNWTF